MQLLKKHKKFLLFILIIIVIGLISGTIYYSFLKPEIKTNIFNTINELDTLRYNNIFKDLFIMSMLLVSSFFIIGIPLSILYIFYESFSLGFLTLLFLTLFHIKGLIYLIFFIAINKLIVFVLMLFFIKKIINIGRFTIGSIIYKKETLIKEKIILNFVNSLYIIIFVFIINIILYFISPLLFNLLI